MIKFIYTKTTQGQVDHLKTLVGEKHSLDDFDLILAEDRFTLSLENALLDSVEGKSSFSFNVFSFARLASTLAKGKSSCSSLSKTGGVMAISKILIDIKDELKCYRKLANGYSSLSSSLFEIIAQLKSSMISFGDLLDAKSPSVALSNKAHDIGRVFEEYEKFKKSEILDAQDKADLLARLIPSSELIANSRVIVLGFTSFTKQFYTVLGKIFATAKEVVVYILDGENEIYDKTVPKNLEAAAKAVGKSVSKEFLKENLSKEQKAINEYLFSFTPKKNVVPVETDRIFLKKGRNFSKELEEVAVDILKKVKNGARFSDFAVMCSSVETDGELIGKVFDDYGIPAFLDDRISLFSHVLSKTAISALMLSSDDYLRKNSSRESFFTILYSPYIESDDETKQNFENYMLKRGIKKSTLKKACEDEDFESVRKGIFSLIPSLPKVATVSRYVDETKKLLSCLADKNEIAYERFISAGEREFAALTLQSAEKFSDVLEELKNLIGETAITLDDFIAVLSDGLLSKELSLAPLFVDNVFVGDFSSSKIMQKKHLYAVSVNNRLVPFQKADVGLLTDKDIDGLQLGGVDLEPKIAIVNEREKFNVFLSLHNFTDTLTLSYSDFSAENDVLGKSEVVSVFEDVFTVNGAPLSVSKQKSPDLFDDDALSSYVKENLPTKTVIAKKASLAFSDKSLGGLYIAAKNAFLKNDENFLSSLLEKPTNYVENAFADKESFSVSDLESYFSCPYKNFVSHSLYAKNRDEAIVRATDSGNYIHKALEIFMASYDSLDEESGAVLAKKIVSDLKETEPYATMNRLPRFSTALSRLDREFFDVSGELLRRKKISSFKSLGEEIRFGYGKTILFDGEKKPLSPLVLPNGERLRGSIDYADFADGHARVIDYKTGVLPKGLSDIYSGRKFQPYIYLAALYESLSLFPAGALYFPVHADFSDEGDSPYKMKGYVLKDIGLIEKMDGSLKAGESSQIVNVSLKNDGDFYKNRGSVLEKSEFSDVIDYSKKLAEKATTEIRQGFIAPRPYEKACEFCDYKGICGYDAALSGERKIKGSVTIETISEATKNE